MGCVSDRWWFCWQWRNVCRAALSRSHPHILVQGYIGMFWDGGHIALEEILAMQTTLLLQHKGISPDLYSDPKRRRPLEPKAKASKAPKPSPKAPKGSKKK